MAHRRLLTALAAAVLLPAALVAAPAGAAPPSVAHGGHGGPRVVDLGSLGGAHTVPNAVNAHGQVVGRSTTVDGRWHAFSWQHGRMTDLTPGAQNAEALDVNDRGHVVVQITDDPAEPTRSELRVGRHTIPLGEVRAEQVNAKGQVSGEVLTFDGDFSSNPFVWTRGTRVDLGSPPNFAGPSSRLVDLDDRGRVLAIGLGPESFELGYLWSAGTFTPIGDPFVFGGNAVVDLTDTGWVLGTAYEGGPFLWRAGVQTWLGLPPGVGEALPVAVDEHGHAVLNLRADPAGTERAHLWDGTRYVPLGPADAATHAFALDDRHRVVGQFTPASDPSRTSAFLLDRGRFTDLGAGIDGVVTAQAVDGRYVMGTVLAPDGTTHALRWTVR